MQIRITNTYEDGHECERTITVEEPDTVDEGFWDTVFTETGCGREGVYALYEARIELSEHPERVGTSREWDG